MKNWEDKIANNHMSWNESSVSYLDNMCSVSWETLALPAVCSITVCIHKVVDFLPGQPLQNKAFLFSVAEDVDNLVFI